MSELSWDIHHSLNKFFESLWQNRQPLYERRVCDVCQGIYGISRDEHRRMADPEVMEAEGD